MRRILLALLAATSLCLPLLAGEEARAQVAQPVWGGVGNQSAAINMTGVQVTQVVAASTTNQRIYVGHWAWMVSAGAAATWVYGTGSNCGTGTTSLTGPIGVPTSAAFVAGDNSGVILFVPAGNALCLNWGGTGTIAGEVTYSQF